MSSTMDAQTRTVGDGSDLKIQATSTAKIALHGATPVVQASAITSPGSTASTSSSPVGFSTTTQADAVVTAVRAIIVALQAKGITA